MDPNKSLEQLLSAQPENILQILQQLMAFNFLIQKSSKEDAIALWHMLKIAENTIGILTDERKNFLELQVLELQNSVKSRMRMLVSEEYRSPEKGTLLEKVFRQTVGKIHGPL